MNINLKTKLFINDPTIGCEFFTDVWRRGATCIYTYDGCTKADLEEGRIKQIRFTLYQDSMEEPLWFQAVDTDKLDEHFIATESGLHFHLNKDESVELAPSEGLDNLLKLQITIDKPAEAITGLDDITEVEDAATFVVLDSIIN